MNAYLDNSATTCCDKEAAELMYRVFTEDYGNPSSMHHAGVVAEQYIKDATARICKALKCDEKEIYYTSCGTEADNLALIGCAHANARKGKHLITTSIEHPAVLNACGQLEKEGFEVTYLPVDSDGLVHVEDVTGAMREDTILVSIMHVNNEIGSVQPIAEIGEAVHKKDPSVLFHVDAVQGFGKFKIIPKRMHIDLLTISGHKIHGPKGMGILYVRDKVKIVPILFGGEQQRGLRSGTENVPGIAGIGLAVEKTSRDLDKNVAHMRELKNYFVGELLKMDQVVIHGKTDETSAPHIISAGFEKVRSEVLLHALEGRGIYVSSGSACASNHPGISGTLLAIGTKKEYLDSTIRFSMSEWTTMEEMEYTVSVLKELLPQLRKFTRH